MNDEQNEYTAMLRSSSAWLVLGPSTSNEEQECIELEKSIKQHKGKVVTVLNERELLVLVEHWAKLVPESEFHAFLTGDVDPEADFWNAGLLNAVAKFVGREKVTQAVDDAWALWKAQNPTLFEIWQNGNKADWDLVQNILQDAMNDSDYKGDFEEFVKTAVQKRQGTSVDPVNAPSATDASARDESAPSNSNSNANTNQRATQ